MEAAQVGSKIGDESATLCVIGHDDVEFADGRRTRRLRNRVAVIEGYLELVAEGHESPSVADVAERSGVSHRSVFRYFADKDDLARTSIGHQMERVGAAMALHVGPEQPLDERIDHLLQRRYELFELVRPVARLMRLLAMKDSAVAGELAGNRSLARDQIRSLFAPELAALSSEHASETLAVIDVLCSFEAGELFTHDLQLDPDRRTAAIRSAIKALLE